MSSQADSTVTASQHSAAKCERCRRDRKKCVKGVVGMTGCKRCTYLGHECSQSADVVAQPSDHPITVRKDFFATPTPAELQKQIGEIPSGFHRASVESVSSEDKKDGLQDKTENPVIEHVTTSRIVPGTDTAPTETENKVLQQFKEFAKQEREGITEKKRAQATQERAIKFKDLRRFSKKFSLKTPVPSDLVSILAKDPDKQQVIIEKAKREHEEAKTNTVKSPQAASDAGVTSIENPFKPSFQIPSKKSAAIVIKDTAGQVVNVTKRLSSTPDGAARVTDSVGTPYIEPQPNSLATTVGAGQPGVFSSKISTTLSARPESSASYLYVEGIDAKVTEDALRQVFETIGRTVLVHIFRYLEPYVKDFAMIRYDDPSAAARAIAALDGRRIYDTEIHIKVLTDSVAGTRGSESFNETATYTPVSRPNPAAPVSGDRAFISYVSNYSSTSNMLAYMPMGSASGNTPYRPLPMYAGPWSSIAQVLNALFTINSLTTNQLLHRNIDFDGYISISVLVQYKMQLGLPATVDAFAIGFTAHYYCSTVECGANPVIRCCLRLRNMPATLLVNHGQRKLEFPCQGRGKHVPYMLRVSNQYGTYSLPSPASLAQSSPYASYASGSAYHTPTYTPYASSYTNVPAYGQMTPLPSSLYPSPMPSGMNFASHSTTNPGHSYGQTNLYNDATAVFGDIYQTHNYYSQKNPQAANTSADHQEQFIEQVLTAAAKFGISTPQVPTVKSKDEVSRWIRDVYEAQLEASTVWGGRMSIVPPSNATSLEPLNLATEHGSSRPASPRPDSLTSGKQSS